MNPGDPDFCESRCPICTHARKGHWLARMVQRIEMAVTFGGCPAGRARRRKYGVGPDEALPPDDAAQARPFTFAQLCDTQLGFGGYEHDVTSFRQAVRQVNALKPAFVVICGDLVDVADEPSFAEFNAIKAELAVPCYCAAGNHDVGSTPSQESLESYRKVVGKDYLSFEHRGYTFVIVNTQLWKAPLGGESEKHDSWLDDTLRTAAGKAAPVIVVGHHPLFLNTPDEEENYFNLPLARRRELLILFEQRGVVAVLGGHTHGLCVNEHKGIQFVNGETTSVNFDKRPVGFRVWRVMDPRPFKHDFVPVEGF